MKRYPLKFLSLFLFILLGISINVIAQKKERTQKLNWGASIFYSFKSNGILQSNVPVSTVSEKGLMAVAKWKTLNERAVTFQVLGGLSYDRSNYNLAPNSRLNVSRLALTLQPELVLPIKDSRIDILLGGGANYSFYNTSKVWTNNNGGISDFAYDQDALDQTIKNKINPLTPFASLGLQVHLGGHFYGRFMLRQQILDGFEKGSLVQFKSDGVKSKKYLAYQPTSFFFNLIYLF